MGQNLQFLLQLHEGSWSRHPSIPDRKMVELNRLDYTPCFRYTSLVDWKDECLIDAGGMREQMRSETLIKPDEQKTATTKQSHDEIAYGLGAIPLLMVIFRGNPVIHFTFLLPNFLCLSAPNVYVKTNVAPIIPYFYPASKYGISPTTYSKIVPNVLELFYNIQRF